MSAIQQMLLAYGAGAACDPYFSHVSLLLHMDGANGSTTFTDSSTNAVAITVTPSAALSTSIAKFGTASGNFTLSSLAQINTPNSALFAFNSVAFTVECWVYRPSTGSGTSQGIFSTRNNSAVYCPFELRVETSGSLSWLIGGAGLASWASTSTLAGVTLAADTWTHIALVGDATTIKVYVNGVASSTTVAQPAWTGTTSTIYIAYGGDGHFPGYVDDFRVTKGLARYTANFTPPTAAFPDTACTYTDPYFSYVTLLLHMDGTSGSSTFVDSSLIPKTVTASDATITTSQFKFGTGGGTIGIAGSGTPLSVVPAATVANFLTNDFTVEGWVYCPTSYNRDIPLVSFSVLSLTMGRRGPPYDDRTFYVTMPGYSGGGVTDVSYVNGWNHWAIVRNNANFGAITAYINGQAVAGEFTSEFYILPTTGNFNIGYVPSAFYWGDGMAYDEVRVTNGIARYTGNFTPPDAPFPNP